MKRTLLASGIGLWLALCLAAGGHAAQNGTWLTVHVYWWRDPSLLGLNNVPVCVDVPGRCALTDLAGNSTQMISVGVHTVFIEWTPIYTTSVTSTAEIDSLTIFMPLKPYLIYLPSVSR